MNSLEKDILYWSKCWEIPGYDWEDLAQELRLKLWQEERKYDKTKASKRTWQITIMRNFLINLIRNVSRSKDVLGKYPLSVELLAEIEDWLVKKEERA